MVCLFLVFLFDIVVTVDGRRIEGKVLKEDERGVELQVKGGKILIPAERVRRVIRCPTAEEEYERRQKDVKDAEGHYRLGLWCLQKGLRREAEEEFKKALKLEPDHTGAKEALKKLHKEEFRRQLKSLRDPAETTLKKKGVIPKDHRLWRLGEWRLSTDLPPEQSKQLLKLLDRFLKLLRKFYPNMVGRRSKPMLVLLFSERQKYREWLKKEKLQRFADAYGCYSGPLRKSFLFDIGRRTPANLLHECMHQVWVERMKRKSVRTSVWLFEGMAEFAEGWWDTNSGRIVPGRIHKGNLYVIKNAYKEGELIDWEKLLSAEKFDDLFGRRYNTKECHLAYAQAWLLYTYLMRRHKGKMLRWLRSLVRGEKADFTEIVSDLDRLRERLRKFAETLK